MKCKTVLVPLTMPLLLAACFGSSSSSGSSWRNFTSFENINPNQRVQFQSGGGSVNYAADVVEGNVSRAGVITTQDARVRVRYGDEDEITGDIEIESLELTVNLPGGAVVRTFDGADISPVGAGTTADRFSEVVISVPALDEDGAPILDEDGAPIPQITDRFYIEDSEDLDLEYMTFGLWELGLDTTQRNIGGAAFGALTPVTGTDSMPITGTATYTGELIGYQVQATQTVVHVATSTLLADFVEGEVTFSSSGTQRLIGGGAASNLDIAPSTADITGNTFRGAVSLAGTDCCPGEFGGAFFGPEAAEAGGWFEVRNTNPAEGFEDNLNDRYFGSFGGKRGAIVD